MFCKYCGNRLEDGDRFCGACGHPVEEKPMQETANEDSYKKQEEKSISEERMGYFLWMIQNGRSRK